MFGRDLHEAREACRRYTIYGEKRDLEKAWEIYYGVSLSVVRAGRASHINPIGQVFKKIEKQLPQLTTLDLQYVSPELLKAKNLELAVPGEPISIWERLRVVTPLTHHPNRNVPKREACDQDLRFRVQVDGVLVQAAASSTLNEGQRR